ncbi:hypothetical protein ALC57_10584 [Trachymyrmex cornetzi]|uniref:Uncharacterized protein n=1 Tax=Trachymyrmex cornetzi TaxID=471704 RepID=A0A151J3X9_9HYME|nr:hypothetical protein ALC57_10584 [Trachymyrmex cornetzi]
MQHQLRQNPTSFADGESKEIVVPQNSDNTASTNSTAQTAGTHLVDGKKDTKKVKGVKSNVVARTITFDDYTCCLNDEIEMTRRQSCIRPKLHEVYTISESKIALSPYDDKRYVVPDSTETLPWEHWQIPL